MIRPPLQHGSLYWGLGKKMGRSGGSFKIFTPKSPLKMHQILGGISQNQKIAGETHDYSGYRDYRV
jgi:hypothetical protein